MSDPRQAPDDIIAPQSTVLDVIHRHRSTEAVFKAYEAEAGACICCEALFEPLEVVAERYELDLGQMLERLRRRVAGEE